VYAPPAYQAPQPLEMSAEQARSKLIVPGIILACLSGLLVLVFLLDTLLFASGMPLTMPGGGAAGSPFGDLPPGFLIGVCLFASLANVFNLVAAIQMVRVRMWGLALAGCIVAAIPLTSSACCILTLPFSIWAIVVLVKPEVRAAFRRPA
jgi:hypothetical protein